MNSSFQAQLLVTMDAQWNWSDDTNVSWECFLRAQRAFYAADAPVAIARPISMWAFSARVMMKGVKGRCTDGTVRMEMWGAHSVHCHRCLWDVAVLCFHHWCRHHLSCHKPSFLCAWRGIGSWSILWHSLIINSFFNFDFLGVLLCVYVTSSSYCGDINLPSLVALWGPPLWGTKS